MNADNPAGIGFQFGQFVHAVAVSAPQPIAPVAAATEVAPTFFASVKDAEATIGENRKNMELATSATAPRRSSSEAA
jgi:hypothetical protein